MDYTTSIFVRLYYYRNGKFDGIENTVFYPLVVDEFSKAGNSIHSMKDFLFESLGYKNTTIHKPSETASKREEFNKKSRDNNYIKSIMKEYNCSDKTQLVEQLSYCGVLGIPDYCPTEIGKYERLGINGSIISSYTSVLLSVLSPYLENKELGRTGVPIRLYRTALLSQEYRLVRDFFNNMELESICPFSVKYDRRLRKPKLLDGILYCSPVEGITEAELPVQLFKLYLLGAPSVYPGFRDLFRSIMDNCIYTTNEESVLAIIDCSHLVNTTVAKMFEELGVQIPDPEELWRKYGGVIYLIGEKELVYSVPKKNPTVYDREVFIQRKMSNLL